MKHFNYIRKIRCLSIPIKAFLTLACCLSATFVIRGEGNSPAANWLSAQVDALSGKLYVYSDYSDSRNAFTQRGVMSYGSVADPQMDEASSAAFLGATAIKVNAQINSGCWSGYYFGNGILEANGAPQFNWGDVRAGMNLQGAQKLVLYARAEQGQTASVNFLIGGNGSGKPNPDSGRKETGYKTLTQEWQRFEIDLAGVNLSYISGGFGWVTSEYANPGKNNIIFYLDEIYYEFAAPRPDPVFPASYAVVPLDNDGYFINSVAYSYDLAMTVLALSYAGKKEQAYKVADGLVFALNNDRKFSPIERGLRNGYGAGNPQSFPGWVSSSGKAPFAKLTGFFDINSQQWWEDYYSDSYSTGNNSWIIIALLEVYRQSGKSEYLEAACTIANYICTLKDEINGGFKGGWEGFDDNQQKAGYSSSEHCIDIYSAFSQLAAILESADSSIPAESKGVQFYRDNAAHAREFVMRMYDPVQGLFYTGTKPDGTTTNKDVYPLDVNTWGLLAFYNDPAVDVQKILTTIENRFRVGNMYDFNDDRDGVWWEGSLQKILVEKVVGNEAAYQAQLSIVNAAAEADGSITAADRDGVTTGIWLEGVNPDGSHKGNEWKYNKRVHVGATAWLALAQLGCNPLDPNRSKNNVALPADTQTKAFVRNGRLYVAGLAPKTPVGVYSADGKKVVSGESSPEIGAETFVGNLPVRGVYFVTTGKDNCKVIY
jgi:hypothetical protein